MHLHRIDIMFDSSDDNLPIFDTEAIGFISGSEDSILDFTKLTTLFLTANKSIFPIVIGYSHI